jgi:hypothetical protein
MCWGALVVSAFKFRLMYYDCTTVSRVPTNAHTTKLPTSGQNLDREHQLEINSAYCTVGNVLDVM